MTREEAIVHGEEQLEVFSGEHAEFIKLAIEALKTLEDFERAQIITGGRLNGRTFAYKCGLEDGKRKALEQEHILDQLKAEIDWERKWLAQAGYNAYNVNIAFSSINNILRK